MIKPTMSGSELRIWFTSKGLEALDYQVKCIKDITNCAFDESEDRLPVLAASPNAGKTLMIICFLYFYFKANPKAKVLILAHGTTVLREQFVNEIHKLKDNLNFTFSEITANEKDFSKQVCVAIPQTLKSVIKDLPKFDLIITDEAHEYYLAVGKGKDKGKQGLVKKILKQVRPKHQILLTGTPDKFIFANKYKKGKYKIFAVSLNEVLESNRASDPYVEIASTTEFEFLDKDFNDSGDLKESSHKKITKKGTVESLNQLLPLIIHRVKSVYKNYKKYIKRDIPVFGVFYSWRDVLAELRKTMIVCRSQPQAYYVYQYLKKNGVDALLSTDKYDKNSEQFRKFYERIKGHDGVEMEGFKYPQYTVLVVVDRGILGFNLPELENVVDMSFSKNATLIYQLLCRVVRKHPFDREKLFFKLVPSEDVAFYSAVMQIALSLTDKDYLMTYDGRMWDKRIRVYSPPKEKKCYICKKVATRKGFGGPICNREECHKKDLKYKPPGIKPPERPPFLTLPTIKGIQGVKFFNHLKHFDDSVLNSILHINLLELKRRVTVAKYVPIANIDELIEELENIHNR